VKYETFRNIVLANADGKNIHRINGLLGVLKNSLSNRNYWKNRDKEKYLRLTNIAREAYKSLTTVSRVPCFMDEIEI